MKNNLMDFWVYGGLWFMVDWWLINIRIDYYQLIN